MAKPAFSAALAILWQFVPFPLSMLVHYSVFHMPPFSLLKGRYWTNRGMFQIYLAQVNPSRWHTRETQVQAPITVVLLDRK